MHNFLNIPETEREIYLGGQGQNVLVNLLALNSSISFQLDYAVGLFTVQSNGNPSPLAAANKNAF